MIWRSGDFIFWQTIIMSNMDEVFHLGKLIKSELNRQQRTVVWLARHIQCERTNCSTSVDLPTRLAPSISIAVLPF